ncbi:MAG: hypothetical protein IJ565_00810 [Bacilli bacterium]|nr:hypothetical protein [Bacilli bacterium]
MEKLISFIIYFILIYLFYFFTVIIQKKKYDKYKKSKQVMYFVNKYNLDFDKIPFNKFINILSIVNSFIMSITIILVQFLPNLILKLIFALITLILLILICYRLLGIYIERRNKNV